MSLFIHGFHCCPPEFFFDVIGTSSVVSPFFVAIHRSARAGIRQGIGKKYSVEYLFFSVGEKEEGFRRGFPSDSPRSFALPAAVLPLQRKKAELPCAVVLSKRAAGISGDPIPTFHLSASATVKPIQSVCVRSPHTFQYSYTYYCIWILQYIGKYRNKATFKYVHIPIQEQGKTSIS